MYMYMSQIVILMIAKWKLDDNDDTVAGKVWLMRVHEIEIVRKHLKSTCVKELYVSGWYTLTMDLSVLIIDDDHEIDRILENTNLEEYELTDLLIYMYTCTL